VNKITGAGTIKTGYDGSAGYQNLTIGIDNGSSTFAGVIANADATGNLVKAGTGAIMLSGTNTYSGSTTVNDGTLKVTTLGTTGGSSVGSSDRSNTANLILNGAVTLEYAGAGESTSRSFTVSGTGLTLSSTGAGAVNFTVGSSIAFADSHANRELKLSGTNTGANTLGSSLSGTPSDADKINRIIKDGVGTWILSGPANRFRNALSIDVNAGTLGLESGAVGHVWLRRVARLECWGDPALGSRQHGRSLGPHLDRGRRSGHCRRLFRHGKLRLRLPAWREQDQYARQIGRRHA